jgi:hypothetical protein
MLRATVKRDQFGLSPQGIVHKPTDAAFTPDPTDPYSGIMRLGHLGNSHPNGGGFSPDEVCRLMNELWVITSPATRSFSGSLAQSQISRVRPARRIACLGHQICCVVGMLLGRDYFLRQAASLLETARSITHPQQAADLVAMVIELSAPDDPQTEVH